MRDGCCITGTLSGVLKTIPGMLQNFGATLPPNLTVSSLY
jgi:hypothetical protein